MQSSFLSLHTLDVLKHRRGKKLSERCNRISRRGWWCWLIIKVHLSYRLRSFTKSSRWFNVVGDPLENICCIAFVFEFWIFRNWNEKILLPSVRWVMYSSTWRFEIHQPDFVRCPLEWVICNLFWYLCCFRQGFMRVTLRNKTNIGLKWFMSISSSDFWLLCCTITHYNYKGKMAKISPKIHKIEIWPKSRPKVINSPNKSHRDHIWGMFEL